VFQDRQEPEKHLIVPRIVANSTEVVRAVVRVETTGEAKVAVTLEDTTDDRGGRSRRRRLSEDEFFDAVADQETADTIRTLLSEARELGAIVERRSKSPSVRLKDPKGSSKRLTLFVIKTNGEVYTGWLYYQLQGIGLDSRIAEQWVESVADLVPGVERNTDPRYPDWLSRNITVAEIEPVLDDFVDRLRETIEAIRSGAG